VIWCQTCENIGRIPQGSGKI